MGAERPTPTRLAAGVVNIALAVFLGWLADRSFDFPTWCGVAGAGLMLVAVGMSLQIRIVNDDQKG